MIQIVIVISQANCPKQQPVNFLAISSFSITFSVKIKNSKQVRDTARKTRFECNFSELHVKRISRILMIFAKV